MAKRYVELPETRFRIRTVSEEAVNIREEELRQTVQDQARKHDQEAEGDKGSWRFPRFSYDKPGTNFLTPNEPADVVFHLDRISMELEGIGGEPPKALVLSQGSAAKKVFMNVAGAGIAAVAPKTGDWRLDANPKLALYTVPLGDKPSRELFANAYAVLKAAGEGEVQAIFLDGVGIALSKDQRFLQRAAEVGYRVFSPFETDNSRQYWIEHSPDEEATVTPGNWRTCHNCKLTFDNGIFEENDYHCPACGTLARLGSEERIEDILDDGIFEEWDTDIADSDPLDFPGYEEKIAALRQKTGLNEAVRTGKGAIGRVPVAVGFMDSSFFMGSMGSLVGEKVSRLFDRATDEGLPVVIFCSSGGARMQEGLASLMQMAKTSCAIERHDRAGLLYISVLTDPTTGGVTASFATLGDIILAEPKTLIGFAGQRVIRDTIKQELPEGFQTAEFALKHGLIDAIVERPRMRKSLKTLLRLHCGKPEPEDKETNAEAEAPLDDRARRRLERHAKRGLKKAGLSADAEPGSAWESVQLARNVHRPTAMAYIRGITEVFFELHGDRAFADDEAIVGGIGVIGDRPVTIIAEEKGSDLNSRVRRHFGCPMPEGYRKSARLMAQAEKFGRPVVCLVDTQGAFCGTEAEERGQGNAIAENLKLMAGLSVPILSVLLGEGGSGGALALAVANRVAMQEHSVYSVVSPEGCASILWKDGKRAPEAASAMQMDSASVLDLGVVDDVLSEGPAAAHKNPEEAIQNVKAYVEETLDELCVLTPDELIKQRQERFSKF